MTVSTSGSPTTEVPGSAVQISKEPHLQAALTTHVDDLAVVGTPSYMQYLYEAMTAEFGYIKDKMPFPHCGCLYSKNETGPKI